MRNKTQERGSTCWLCCWAADMLRGWDWPESRLGWGRVDVHRHLSDDIIPVISRSELKRHKKCVFVLTWPVVRAGSSRAGSEGQELHRRNPDWGGRRVRRLPLTGSSLSREQTVRRDLQPVEVEREREEVKRTETHTDACSGSFSDTYCGVWLWGRDR